MLQEICFTLFLNKYVIYIQITSLILKKIVHMLIDEILLFHNLLIILGTVIIDFII